jgi:probable rRNA maturation factor
MAILFFTEDIKKPNFHLKVTVNWLKSCIAKYKKKAGSINYILCSDEYLRAINNQYLNHDYYTDIITFNNSVNDVLSADIYISIERVIDNAEKYKVSFINEFNRVMVHGILHLIGYNDGSDSEKQHMRIEEDICLSLFDFKA